MVGLTQKSQKRGPVELGCFIQRQDGWLASVFFFLAWETVAVSDGLDYGWQTFCACLVWALKS